MTRKSKTAGDERPPSNISDEARAAAEAQAAGDAAWMAALQERSNAVTRPPAPTRQVSIQQLFGELVALAASGTGKRYRNNIPQVSEASAVKILELTLGWALNSRNGALPEILADGDTEGMEPSEADIPELPEPDEIIEAADESADQE